MAIDISSAVRNRNFLPLRQRTFPEYQNLTQGKHGPAVGDPIDVAELRSAAQAAECLDLFERDMAVAPLAISSRAAIHRYVDDGGKSTFTNDDSVSISHRLATVTFASETAWISGRVFGSIPSSKAKSRISRSNIKTSRGPSRLSGLHGGERAAIQCFLVRNRSGA